MQTINKVSCENLEQFIAGCLKENSSLFININVEFDARIVGEIILEYFEYNGSYLNVHVFANKNGKELSNVRKIDVTSVVDYLDYAKLVHTEIAKAYETFAFLQTVDITENS